MTKLEMDKLLKDIFNKVQNIRDAGQQEYARTDQDVFANFKRVASYTNGTKESVCMTYLMKHIDGIASHINGNQSQREHVTGRITDAIVYLCLLWGMVDDSD
jgi:predicted AAA+ superfamily ATPase